MFSPVTAVTAGALVLAASGLLLITQPFGQDGITPGAEAPPVEPTWVTGSGFWAPSCTGPESVEVDGDVTRETGYVCEPTRNVASDPRLTAEGTWRWNADVYDLDIGRRVVINGAEYLTNDEGGWTCPITRLARATGFINNEFGSSEIQHCVGDGGYDGLSAILVWEGGNASSSEFVGLIFSGDVPPVPLPPTSEDGS